MKQGKMHVAAVAAAGCLAAAALAWPGNCPAAQAPSRALVRKIAALARGGPEQRARADFYRLLAVRAPERLPRGLRADPGSREALPMRCGTPAVRAAAARLTGMPPGLRADAEPLLRPARRGGARGAAAASPGDKAASHELANWLVTTNFSIEWGPDLTNEDGTTPPRDDAPLWDGDPAVGGNGIPDVAERWAAYFEAAYGVEVGEMGYAHPAVEGNRIPVYIANSDPDTLLENLGGGTYALTQFDPGQDAVPYIVVNNDLATLVRATNRLPAGAAVAPSETADIMKVTAAHELFHVFHFLYEPQGWVPVEDDWWFEASATWMEDEVFDSVNDYVQYLGDDGWPAFVEQGLPVRFTDPHYTLRAYGAVIFAKYLSEHVGGRRSIFDLWELIRPGDEPGDVGMRILEALDAYAAAQGFEGLPDLFLGFAGAVAVMDFEEGAFCGRVVTLAGLSHDSEQENLPVPGYLGAVYTEDVPAADFTLSLEGAPAKPWGLAVVVERPDGGRMVLGSFATGGAEVAARASGGNVHASVAYLARDAAPESWLLSPSSQGPSDTVAPAAVRNLAVSAVRGGFDAVWAPPGDPDVAGYLVTWDDGAGNSGSRTLFGPVTGVGVRELPVGTYDVGVLAYDASGNPGPAKVATVEVSEPAADASAPAAVFVDWHLETASAKDGGGGGGGCFVRTLLRGVCLESQTDARVK